MIIGICVVCKGPVSDEDALVLFQRNMYHVSRSTCDAMRAHIAEQDAKFLAALRIREEFS